MAPRRLTSVSIRRLARARLGWLNGSRLGGAGDPRRAFTNDLSPHEHFVVERTNAGEVADFTAMAGPGGVKPSVRAGFLRKLMLGIDPSWTIRTPGVRLRGARIEGVLDLTDCSGVGGAGLPAPR